MTWCWGLGQFLLKIFHRLIFCSIPLPASALSVFLLLSFSPLYVPLFSSFPVFRYFVSVYNRFSPSLLSMQSPSPSVTLFLPPAPVTLIPCLIHRRFIGIQAGLFWQAITVQNSMKAQFSKCAFSLFSLTPPSSSSIKESSSSFLCVLRLSFVSFPHSVIFYVCLLFQTLFLLGYLSAFNLTPAPLLFFFYSVQLHPLLVDPFLLCQFPL